MMYTNKKGYADFVIIVAQNRALGIHRGDLRYLVIENKPRLFRVLINSLHAVSGQKLYFLPSSITTINKAVVTWGPATISIEAVIPIVSRLIEFRDLAPPLFGIHL